VGFFSSGGHIDSCQNNANAPPLKIYYVVRAKEHGLVPTLCGSLVEGSASQKEAKLPLTAKFFAGWKGG
jgi:hypothetical protein